MMMNMRKHRKRVDDETGTDDDSITSDGVCVYFYAEVAHCRGALVHAADETSR